MTFTERVERELEMARATHVRPHSSPHESYGVMLEKVQEFFDSLRQNPPNRQRMLEELVQVGAMAQRAAEDNGLLASMSSMQPRQMADMGAGFIRSIVDRATRQGEDNLSEKKVSQRG